MKCEKKIEITAREREAMERTGLRVLKWLANGASTDDAMKGALRCGDHIYMLTMAKLEGEKLVYRTTWGALSVWKKV